MKAWFAAVHESAFVKVFGCRPMTVDATHSEGRRTKTFKGGNRGGEGAELAARQS
jgi:hypothetical protein